MKQWNDMNRHEQEYKMAIADAQRVIEVTTGEYTQLRKLIDELRKENENKEWKNNLNKFEWLFATC